MPFSVAAAAAQTASLTITTSSTRVRLSRNVQFAGLLKLNLNI